MSESQNSDPNPAPGREARLSDLIPFVPHVLSAPAGDAPVGGIALDSRQVRPGDIFVALQGSNVDGHRFIPDALRRGATAVIGTQPQAGLGAPYVLVSDGRLALAYLSAAFYGFPAHDLHMIGVTGTDGKTTTCNLIYQILLAAGFRAGMVSTVNAVIGDEVLDTGFHVTTPEAPDVQRYLAQMRQAGLTHVVLEATSHGLAQRRVAACEFDLGVVTNITHEHLDYHGSYENYRAAKGLLFSGLADTPPKAFHPRRAAILNRDDASYAYLASITSVDQITYGIPPSLWPNVSLHAERIQYRPGGMRFEVVGENLHFPVESRLVGAFNLSNILAAVATCVLGLGLPPQAAAQGVAALEGVPGRMERIDLGQSFTAIVDFAHTPNALRRALEVARQLAGEKRVIAVFGSAGLRDREKRRLMAETSAELANLTILTAEDPRSESLPAILAEMASGAQARGAVEGQSFWRIADRGEALRLAVRMAQPGDVVIACGKGHEQSMCFGETEYAWDDRQALRAALSESLGLSGPAMPYLPTQD